MSPSLASSLSKPSHYVTEEACAQLLYPWSSLLPGQGTCYGHSGLAQCFHYDVCVRGGARAHKNLYYTLWRADPFRCGWCTHSGPDLAIDHSPDLIYFYARDGKHVAKLNRSCSPITSGSSPSLTDTQMQWSSILGGGRKKDLATAATNALHKKGQKLLEVDAPSWYH